MWRIALLCLMLLFRLPAAASDLPGGEMPWFASPPRLPAVQLYFFWSIHCPHCLEARPFVEALGEELPWLQVHSLEVLEHPQNRARFEQMAALLGISPQSVPTFMWCGRHYTGFADVHSSGGYLLSALVECYQEHYGVLPAGIEVDSPTPEQGMREDGQLAIPWLGALDPGHYSLPMLALILGALDAFNPCAFFVLLFLLSLLVNTRSRARMLLVGGVFVLVSGLVYFAFMAAWLNLFRVLGGIALITTIAGVVALGIGLINVKDYFRFHQGVSLSISAGHKERLFGRMRRLLDTERLPALLAGTLTLALAANTYELLCTAGLPMVFTRMLTLEPLPALHYYAYLALYNLVYVLPLAAIVGLFVLTMGRRKLKESEGRFLKLLSGSMMGGLGLLLILAPQKLSSPLPTLLLIFAAVLISLAVHGLAKRRNSVRL